MLSSAAALYSPFVWTLCVSSCLCVRPPSPKMQNQFLRAKLAAIGINYANMHADVAWCHKVMEPKAGLLLVLTPTFKIFTTFNRYINNERNIKQHSRPPLNTYMTSNQREADSHGTNIIIWPPWLAKMVICGRIFTLRVENGRFARDKDHRHPLRLLQVIRDSQVELVPCI